MKRSTDVITSLLGLALLLSVPALASSTTSIPVGLVPKFVAVNETTNVIYVSNLIGNSVSVIDGAAGTVTATIPVGVGPEVIDVNSITNTVYVANLEGNSVSVIDGASNTVSTTITGLHGPFGVAVNAITNQVFVSNNNGTVAVIDGATNQITANIPVSGAPNGLRVNSSTNLVYVAEGGLTGAISVIDGASDTVTNTFALPQGALPAIIAFDPITNRLFVTDVENNVVDVLDASSGALLKTISGGNVPFIAPVYVAMFQPGKSFMVSDDTLNSVTEFSESTYAATNGLKGGSRPEGIAVNRKTGKIYVAEIGTNTVNVYPK
jgi:YVTN family beta-propeller protein